MRHTLDHLRVCGADNGLDVNMLTQAGSPPRVRSRRRPIRHADHRPGITSACAEQTASGLDLIAGYRDHLRVCGADAPESARTLTLEGSPPRVRSRPRPVQSAGAAIRITSACAEQTMFNSFRETRMGDHLRVCGADCWRRSSRQTRTGSPPRVRSRLVHAIGYRVCDGITSACAEQTSVPWCLRNRPWDHLRVCGADNDAIPANLDAAGSPPRVRSRLPAIGGRQRRTRITSACAEQTTGSACIRRATGDHLRVCGADRNRYDRH